MEEKVRSLEEAEQHVQSLSVRMQELERMVIDHEQRFDTLQTSLWKRLLFRIDGWPGQKNLNADAPKWRPWRGWWTS